MRSLANYISLSRIFLSLALVWAEPSSITFLVIYLVCGISDMMDGYIARKTNTESKIGEKLDSAADLIMLAVLMIVLYPVLHLTRPIIVCIVIIGTIRTVSMTVVWVKYRTFAILHTYGNKMTGLLLLLFPLSLGFIRSNVPMYIICAVAGISAMEELAIHLSSQELQANRKSIFS